MNPNSRFAFIVMFALVAGVSAAVAATPLEVVNLRMQALNNHDLETFLGTYAEDAEIFTYPVESLGKGKAHLKGIFGPMFEKGVVRSETHHQIEKGDYVVVHQTVDYGDYVREYVAIYEVRDGLITTIRFLRD
jgi:hypothetical protein